MNRRIVIAVDGNKYLIPAEQAKDLTGLLTQLSAWKRVNNKNYKASEYELNGDNPPSLEVAVVDAENIDGIKDVAETIVKAAKVAEETPF